MKTLISTLVLLLLLGGAAIADQVEFAPSAPRVAASTVGDAGAPLATVAKAGSSSLGSHLLNFIRARVCLWLGLDLFDGPDEPSGPQLDDGRHTGRQLVVPLRDAGGDSKDI